MSASVHPRIGEKRRGRAHWAAIASLAFALALVPAVLLRYRLVEVRVELAQRDAALAALESPRGDVSILRLEPARADDAAAPMTRLALGDEPGLLVLRLAPGDDGAGPYRVELRDGAGELRWRGDELGRDAAGDLTLAIPSGFLEPGDHELAVSVPGLGDRVELARYRLQVVRE